MRDIHELLREKEQKLAQTRNEVNALRLVAQMLDPLGIDPRSVPRERPQ